MLEEFLALVAHEVRMPLAVVKTGVQLLGELDARGISDPSQRAELLAMWNATSTSRCC